MDGDSGSSGVGSVNNLDLVTLLNRTAAESKKHSNLGIGNVNIATQMSTVFIGSVKGNHSWERRHVKILHSHKMC